MGERPVELAGLGIDGSGSKKLAIDPGHGHNFRIVPRREDFVRQLEFPILKSFLNHCHTGVPQQPDHSLAGDACQECTIGDWRVNDPPFAINTFEVASSATLPSTSQTMALSNPRACAWKSARALLG